MGYLTVKGLWRKLMFKGIFKIIADQHLTQCDKSSKIEMVTQIIGFPVVQW